MRLTSTLLKSVALISAGSLLLAGCSAGSSGAKDSGGEKTQATLALTAPPKNLDFTTTSGAAIPQALMSNVYQGLVQLSDKGRIEPLLAEKWEISEDRKSYTFKLREGVTFSNGAAFTAEDVKFSLDRVQSDAWTNGLKAKMAVIDSVAVKGDLEVVVQLQHPSNDWLFDMTTFLGAIMTPDGVADLANTPVGTGPYVVESWVPDQSLKFKTRDDYWGVKPGVQELTLRYFKDPTAANNAIKTGDVDALINHQSPETLAELKADSNLKVTTGTSSGEVTLSFNNKKAPFDDVRVRKAVLYALDKQAIIDTAWNGYGTVVATFATPTDPYYEDLNNVYPHDPEKARKLLKEAGQENLEINYTVPTLPYANAVSEIVVSQLKEAGIKVNISSAEFPGVWLDEVFKKKDYQMTTINHVEAHDMLSIFNNPDYYIGYDNSKIAPLAAEADAADEKGYVNDMKKIARQIVDDAASGVLFLFPNITVFKKDLQGLPLNSIIETLDLTKLSWK